MFFLKDTPSQGQFEDLARRYDKMDVHPDFRGAVFGTAKALWSVALEWAKVQNISEIFLGTTEKFLAAHRFYEKNGFVSIEKESLPPQFPLMSVDTKFYTYPII